MGVVASQLTGGVRRLLDEARLTCDREQMSASVIPIFVPVVLASSTRFIPVMPTGARSVVHASADDTAVT